MDFMNDEWRDYEYMSSNIIRPMTKPDNDSPYGNVLLYKYNGKENFEKTEDAYLDRMRSWEPDKYNKASKAINKNILYRIVGEKVEDVEKFLTVYNGYRCKLLEASENLGYDGYHYTYLRWTKI